MLSNFLNHLFNGIEMKRKDSENYLEGATTFRIMTLRTTTLCTMTLRTMTLYTMTLRTMTLRTMTLCTMTLHTMTLRITTLRKWHSGQRHLACLWHSATLTYICSVTFFNEMLSVIMMSVVRLNVNLPNVVAPSGTSTIMMIFAMAMAPWLSAEWHSA